MTPSERVSKFLVDMTDWEQKTFPILSSGKQTQEERAAARSSLAAIFKEHLSEKAQAPNRWGMKLAGPDVSSPPQYDQQVTKVEDGAKRSTFHVYTKHRAIPNNWWRYSVVLDARAVPQIDDVRIAYVEGGEWKRCPY